MPRLCSSNRSTTETKRHFNIRGVALTSGRVEEARSPFCEPPCSCTELRSTIRALIWFSIINWKWAPITTWSFMQPGGSEVTMNLQDPLGPSCTQPILNKLASFSEERALLVDRKRLMKSSPKFSSVPPESQNKENHVESTPEDVSCLNQLFLMVGCILKLSRLAFVLGHNCSRILFFPGPK